MKILLFGKDGQVGWELQRSLAPLGYLLSLGRQEADFTDPEILRHHIRAYKPNVIVNAAAYTAVDKAESEPTEAHQINTEAVKVLADEAAVLGAYLLHYSTDYVFDGKKSSAYIETDITAPINIYGESKAAGENAIRNSGCRHLILRSSWIYSGHGMNFPLAILRKALESDEIHVIDDSFGAPTSASLIADTTALMIYRIGSEPLLAERVIGTYHLVASGETSWYGYAKFLINIAQKKGLPVKTTSNKVFPINGESYKTAAQRPKNCRLDNTKMAEMFNLVLPNWKDQVTRFVDEIVKPKPL